MSQQGARQKIAAKAGRSRLLPLFFLPFFLCPLPAALAAEEPISIKADQVEYFDAVGKVEAKGSVRALYKEATLTCDSATIYMETKDAYLKGRVRIVQPDGLLKGEEVLYNFQTRKGSLLEAEGQADPWRTKGASAQKVAGSAFLHEKGYVTTCDFEEPHTRLQGKEVRIFMDDKVVLKNVVMYVGKIPVFYLPSYTHPLDDKRPRVTIIPGKDKKWGLFALTTWRLYVNENLQGRVHIDYRERLDLASGADFKYELPSGGEGFFRSYYTNEREIQRKHLWSKYYHAKKNRQLTLERERFLVQLRHRWEVDSKTSATLEFSGMRDPAMLKDFFLRDSDREQNPATYFQIVRGTSLYGLTFVVDKRINKFETKTQQWPSVSIALRPFSMPWLPHLPIPAGVSSDPAFLQGWQYQSTYNASHTNVSSPKEGTKESLLSFDTLQQIFYPMRLFRRFNFRPFFHFQETSFSRGAQVHRPLFRQAAATGFDLTTKFFRTFLADTNLWGMEIHRLRHIVTPTLGYNYQARSTPTPALLRADPVKKSNTLSMTMEHKLQTKRQDINKDLSITKDLTTIDLVRFSTSIPYDLEGPDGRGGRWGNVGLDLETKPYRWLYLESDASVDTRIGKVTAINADLIAAPLPTHFSSSPASELGIGEYNDPKDGKVKELPWALGLGWRYQRDTSAQMVLETEFNLGEKWRAGIYQAFDVKRFALETSDRGNRTVKKIYDFPEVEYRLRRDLHEWTGEIVYTILRGRGESLLFIFRLKAFPEMPFEFERHYHQPKAGKNFPKPGEIRD